MKYLLRTTLLSLLSLALACSGEPSDGSGTTCTTDADCVALGADIDRCAASFQCVSGRCVLDSSPVSCGNTNPCEEAVCLPETGACEVSPRPDGATCDDGNQCTTDSVCQAGSCDAGLPACSTDNPCLTATCNPADGSCGSEERPDFSSCEDGDPCTSGDVCVSGRCGGQAMTCEEDDNPCTIVVCNGGECLPLESNDGAACDDGDPCTVNDACLNKLCAPGSPKCEASTDPCISVDCAPETGVCNETALPDDSNCDDGDPCTVDDRCEAGACAAGTAKCTPSTDPCLVESCEPSTGTCLSLPAEGAPACTDGDACTTSDICVNGQCLGTPVSCEQDDNPCTVNTCGFGGQCITEALLTASACDDGDSCTINDHCEDGACKADFKCVNDDNTCTEAVCDPITAQCGTLFLENGTGCNDGNPCTSGETCTDVVCGGGAPTVCEDDNNACTLELCIADQGGCLHVPAPEGAQCNSGDPCLGGATCQGGDCIGGALVECEDDGSPCTLETCVSEVGCVSELVSDETPCDDGDACTENTVCTSGSCVGTPLDCIPSTSCKAVSCDSITGCTETTLPDGIACEDSDLCTSETTCEEGLCTGGLTKDCPQPGDDCIVGVCIPTSGVCTTAAAQDGAACEDGDLCTLEDTCASGSCAAGQPTDCGLPFDECTALFCESSTGNCSAQPLAEGAACGVGSPCTTTGICESGACSSETVVDCPVPEDPCVVALCDPNSGGCVELPASEGSACNDGNPCTENTLCVSGTCAGGDPLECPDDGDTCSLEFCDPVLGCTAQSAQDGVSCEDSDPCTDQTHCEAGVCLGGEITTCPNDGLPCTSDLCVPGNGCVYPLLPDGESCNDNSLCTVTETCQSGACTGPVTVTCPPSEDTCLLNACQPETGVCGLVPGPDGSSCDDGSVCTTLDHCVAGLCTGDALACPQDDDPCTISQCDPGPGKCVTTGADPGTPCDDDALCTEQDVCDGLGGCEGSPISCLQPDEPCEYTACDVSTGECVLNTEDNGSPCEDSDPCTSGDFCLQGVCVLGGQPTCVPSGPCVTVTCDGDTGTCSESPLSLGSICNDGDACTTGETCQNEICSGGTLTVCDSDGNPCTDAVCNNNSGVCETLLAIDGANCNDENPCTEADVCTTGVCSGVTVTCADSGNVCREVTCQPALGGCTELPLDDGLPCSDPDICTVFEACLAGDCVGQPVQCPPSPSTCQLNVCHPDTGCLLEDTNEGGLCSDNPCLVNSACDNGVCSGGQPLDCGSEAPPCEEPVCDSALGCTTQPTPEGSECEDGDLCTSTGSCIANTCVTETVNCGLAPVCHTVACTPTKGCVTTVAPDGTDCNDGNACTPSDTCTAGVCLAGPAIVCSGGSECQPESCDPDTGQCVAKNAVNGTQCDDGNLCSQTSSCENGVCTNPIAVECEQPADPCLVAVCSPANGQCEIISGPDGAPCNDGSLCTSGDICSDGICIGKEAIVCPAPSGCLRNECDPLTGGCLPALAPDGALCDTGDMCTVGETCSSGSCINSAASTDCCTSALDCDDRSPCTADSCESGRCVHTHVALPACIGRVVVASPDDAEITLLDATTLLPIAALTVPGEVRHLAAAPSAGAVYAAVPDSTQGVLAIDPWQPNATPPVPTPSSGGGHTVTVWKEAGLLVVILPDGSVETFDTQTGAAVSGTSALLPPTGFPALDAQTGRLYVPLEQGSLGLVSLVTPLNQPPTTPWFVGGTPLRAAYDPTSERLFMSDPLSQGVRVVGAQHGSGLSGDSLKGFGLPAGLAVDTRNDRLLVAYPDSSFVRVFDLETLEPASPPGVAIGAKPSGLFVDSQTGSTYVTAAASNQLHVLTPALSVAANSPVAVAFGPTEVLVIWSQPGRVILNEALVDPFPEADANGEWIELHNPGLNSVDLAGWRLETASSTHTIVPAFIPSLVIPAGGYIVLCRNGLESENGGVSCDYTYSGLPLSNEGVHLSLYDAGGLLVDEATLSTPISPGQSLALRHPAYHNARRYSFGLSSGTPGAINSDVLDSL